MNEEVEKELEELVSLLSLEIPSLKEIRIFGSYNNGNWNKLRSDIDLFVLIKDEQYNPDIGTRPHPWSTYAYLESEQREELRKRINLRLFHLKYKERFKLHLITPEYLNTVMFHNEGRGNLGENMKKGKLLYVSEN